MATSGTSRDRDHTGRSRKMYLKATFVFAQGNTTADPRLRRVSEKTVKRSRKMRDLDFPPSKNGGES
jgi:hypothetical protein